MSNRRSLYPEAIRGRFGGTDEVAKATAQAATNTKLTPAAPGWANVESDKIMEDLFVNIAGGGDVASLAKAADEKITAALNR